MCPVGAGNVLICFGSGAHQVAPNALGTRLARVLGDHLAVGAGQGDLGVTVGVATGACGVEQSRVAAEAYAATRRRSCTPGTVPAIVVSSLKAGSRHGVTLTHRRLHPMLSLVDGSTAPASAAVAATPHSDIEMLIVGPPPVSGDQHSPAVEGVLAVTSRVGISPACIGTSDPAAVLARCRELKPDVVVIALRSPAPAMPRRDCELTTPWEAWSQMARELVQANATVWAVGVGAPVAAVAACVREGAYGVLDLWDLADEIEKLDVNLQSRRLLKANDGTRSEVLGVRGGLPAPYDALVELTPGEHRVLYQMMRGASASEIAKQLVVSLATVRSHIRSILRKLGVSSQLAAVALANGSHADALESTI